MGGIYSTAVSKLCFGLHNGHDSDKETILCRRSYDSAVMSSEPVLNSEGDFAI